MMWYFTWQEGQECILLSSEHIQWFVYFCQDTEGTVLSQIWTDLAWFAILQKDLLAVCIYDIYPGILKSSVF